MEINNGWKVFESTGNVIDYLNYIACTEEKDKKGELGIGCRSSKGDGDSTKYDSDR